jgi:hypothetical protein
LNEDLDMVVTGIKKQISDVSGVVLTYNATVFTQQLITKVFKFYGYGPNPKLIHCPLRHKSRKPVINNNED